MQKKILFYICAFLLLLVALFFFNKAYRELTTYSQLTSSHNAVHSIFQNLSREINDAAVLSPDLAKAGNSQRAGKIFFTDSVTIIQQLDFLRSTVKDSINIQIAEKLDTAVKAELSWLLKSNVPDSILNHKSPAHIASFSSIDSLISAGIQRTTFLIE